MRTRPGRTLAAGLALTAVVATTGATGRPDVYAPPAPLPALTAGTLNARYDAARHAIEQARTTARRFHDTGRARVLTDLLTPGRRYLAFDARGNGQAVEVFGDLAGADRVAVVVPGADNTLDTYDSWKFAGGGARSLYGEARRIDPRTRLAVIAWLGYDSPATLSPTILTDGRARSAATRLRALVGGLGRVAPRAQVELLCHSYGSVICAKAVPGLPVGDLALFGSPGTTAPSAVGLHTGARVWAGRTSGDWVAHVPHVRLFGKIGFGADPVSKGFGARIFDAGPGTHSSYLRPGTRSVHNLALIALGRAAEVTLR